MSEAKNFEKWIEERDVSRLHDLLQESERQNADLRTKWKQALEEKRLFEAGADGHWPQSRIAGVLMGCDRDGPWGASIAVIGRHLANVREIMSNPALSDADLRAAAGAADALDRVRRELIAARLP